MRIWRFGFELDGTPKQSKTFLSSIIVYIILLSITAFISLSRIGLTQDIHVSLNWGDPGTPLLGLQIFGAYLASAGVFLFYLLLTAFPIVHSILQKPIFRDSVIFLLLWILASWLWLAEPIHPTYFAPKPRLPNFEVYPYSDAGNYDLTAQYLLAGNGIPGIAKRPLYSTFLAGLHALSGYNYQMVTSLQVIVLALIPALLYLLMRRIHYPMTGVFLALLIILRERNAIAISGIANISHSKLLMTDMPTLLGVVLLTLILTLWFESPERRQIYALMAGGIIGLWILVRLQFFVLILPVLILIFFVFIKQPKTMVKFALIFLLGTLLAITPWLIRNWQLTGYLALDSPGQVGDLASRYQDEPLTGTISLQNQENEGEFFQRMTGSTLGYVLTKPDKVFGFTAEHFLHNLVTTLFALPVSYPLVDNGIEFYNKYPYWRETNQPPEKLWEQCCSLIPYISTDVPFWQGWNGKFTTEARVPILVNLLIVAIGIAAAYRQKHMIALIPLAVYLGYDLSNALIRSSGWRFILPVDWVILFYYSIGLIQLTIWAASFFQPILFSRWLNPENIPAENNQPVSTSSLPLKSIAAVSLVILILGSAISIGEGLVPIKYRSADISKIISTLSDKDLSKYDLTAEKLKSFLETRGGHAIFGRVLSPKFFLAGEPERWYSNWESERTRNFDELDFMLIGTESYPAFLNWQGKENLLTPSPLPNAVDVLAMGCVNVGIFDTKLLLKLDQSGQYLLQSPNTIWNCPIPQ